MKPVRLRFKKSGAAVYISHLDVVRCIARALRRAKLPIWYTEGFNPRPYTTFPLPLPLGQSGESEPFDIKIEEDVSFEEIKNRLNAVLPGGLEIVDVREPERRAVEIAAAEYEVKIVFKDENDAETFARKASEICEGGTLQAEKRSKKGIKTVNLCETIRSFEAKSSGNAAEISATLAAGSRENLNCGLLTDALLSACGIEPVKTEIKRLRLLDEKLKVFR